MLGIEQFVPSWNFMNNLTFQKYQVFEIQLSQSSNLQNPNLPKSNFFQNDSFPKFHIPKILTSLKSHNSTS